MCRYRSRLWTVPVGEMTRETGTLQLRRERSAWRDRARAYEVLLDGHRIGEVGNGREFTTAVEPGKHSIRLRLDWTGSPTLEFEIEPGETARFICSAAEEFMLLSLVKSIWRRDAWIDLRPG